MNWPKNLSSQPPPGASTKPQTRHYGVKLSGFKYALFCGRGPPQGATSWALTIAINGSPNCQQSLSLSLSQIAMQCKILARYHCSSRFKIHSVDIPFSKWAASPSACSEHCGNASRSTSSAS